MRMRWAINLALALLVSGTLATAITAGIAALLPLMARQPPPWLEPWLPALCFAASLSGPIVMLIQAYRRRRAKTLRQD
jgi:hypothetical protein